MTAAAISQNQADELAHEAAEQYADILGAAEDFEEQKNAFMYFFEFGHIAVIKRTGKAVVWKRDEDGDITPA